MVAQGEVYWVDLGEPEGSEPGYRRPVIIVQADDYNQTPLPTTVVCSLTTNLRLSAAPGNVVLPAGTAGLRRDSVAVVTQLSTLDLRELGERIGRLPDTLTMRVLAGVAAVFGLSAGR